MSWSRVSVFFLLLLATSCLEGAAKHVKSDMQGDSPPDPTSPENWGETKFLRECCFHGRQSVHGSGSCHEKASRYLDLLKTLSFDENKARSCVVIYSSCCHKASNAPKTSEGLVTTDSPPDRDATTTSAPPRDDTTTSAPAKDVKQLGGGSTETGGDTDRQKASRADSGDHELRESCCDRGHQSIRQRGHCGGKARSYVRTLSLDRRQAKLCRLLFGACCYRASRVAKPTAPQTPGGEVKQLGGATSGDGEADQKEAKGPAWKRRLEKRCCSAGKRSAAATPGACQTRARTVARKARARVRGGARSAAKEVEGCSQIFMRCCNEVPIG